MGSARPFYFGGPVAEVVTIFSFLAVCHIVEDGQLVHDDTNFEAQALALDAADPELAALFIAAIAAASTVASSRADAVSAHQRHHVGPRQHLATRLAGARRILSRQPRPLTQGIAGELGRQPRHRHRRPRHRARGGPGRRARSSPRRAPRARGRESSRVAREWAPDNATSAQKSAAASSTAACNRGGARVYLAEGCG